MPSTDVEWVITPSGELTVSWLNKIANFEEDNKVKLKIEEVRKSYVKSKMDNKSLIEIFFSPLSKINGNETREVDGSALGVSAGGLKLGQKYKLSLTDLDEDDSFGPIHIEACKVKNYYVSCIFIFSYSLQTPTVLMVRGQVCTALK